MTATKYSNILTIILIILIIAIIGGVGFLVWDKVLKPKKQANQKMEVIAEFDKEIEDNNKKEDDDKNGEKKDELTVGESNPTGNNDPEDEPDNVPVRKKTYYQGHVMLGYITISKTSVKEPILDTVTPDTLNTAVATLYPSNPQLNEPGNVVIIGHNYRNGTFFSDNKKLSVGDKIKIKDNTGRELTYTIYQKFEASENDTSFYNRDTNGAIEVTLSTCTDDVKARIIILARVEE